MQELTHGCDLETCGVTILPLSALRRKHMRCCHNLVPFRRASLAVIPHDYARYVSRCGQPYYKVGNFITPSDCNKPKVLRAFLLAKSQILQCMSQTPFTTENWEIVVVIYCVRFRSPEYGYYIADRYNRTIRWVHGGPQEILSREEAQIRGTAEYWRHIAQFPTHRFCSEGDLQATRSRIENSRGTLISEGESETWSQQLEQLSRSERDPNMHTTFSVAKINQVLAERHIPLYYNSVSMGGGFVKGLLASIFGLFVPRRNQQPPPEHPEDHTDSSRSSSPPSSPSSQSSPNPGDFPARLSASMNGAVTPALVEFGIPAPDHPPTHSSSPLQAPHQPSE
ncbi:hypothetical protein FS749_009258 [Ceratobasidium sp. UAMH 11750]|nr:hypothetical protein FS749_009258 [Ceratobasidium sp. UAMH 11750]